MTVPGGSKGAIEALDKLRQRAEELRNAGIRGLCRQWFDSSRHPSWFGKTPNPKHKVLGETVASIAAKVLEKPTRIRWDDIQENSNGEWLVLRALALGWARQVVKREEIHAVVEHLVEVEKTPGRDSLGPGSLYDEDPNIDEHQYEQPLFAATQFLRARLEVPSHGFTDDMVLAYYRTLTELMHADDPDWALGGARANDRPNSSGRASAFVTSEALRAFSHIAAQFGHTATFLSTLANLIQRHAELRATLKALKGVRLSSWKLCDAARCELKSVELQILSVVGGAKGRVPLFLPHKPRSFSFSKFVARILRELKAYVASSRATLARQRKKIPRSRGSYYYGATGQELRHERTSESAHLRALRSLEVAVEHFSAAERVLDGLKDPDDLRCKSVPAASKACDALLKVAETLGALGRRMHENFRAMQVFLKHGVAHGVARSVEQERAAEAGDLCFAAWSLLFQSGSEEEALLSRAEDLLAEAVDRDGRFPISRPFQIKADGRQSVASNVQVLRAYAHIIQRSKRDYSVSDLERLVNFFDADVVVVRDRDREDGDDYGECGWRRQAASLGSPVSVWVTAIAVLALDRIVMSITARINQLVFSGPGLRVVRQPGELRVDELLGGDLGLASVKLGKRPIREVLVRMSAHLRGNHSKDYADADHVNSLILYGPPGTGKTAAAEALALSANVPLVEVTPSAFLLAGADGLQVQADAVMSGLSAVRGAVILFDEFDSILRRRDAEEDSGEQAVNSFSFITGTMLPRLKLLHDKALHNGSCYALATNFVELLDDAAIRSGRFDTKVGVYPADVLSRAFACFLELLRDESFSVSDDVAESMVECAFRVARVTSHWPVSNLARALKSKRKPIAKAYEDDMGPLASFGKDVSSLDSNYGRPFTDATVQNEQQLDQVVIATVIAQWERAIRGKKLGAKELVGELQKVVRVGKRARKVLRVQTEQERSSGPLAEHDAWA